MKSFNQKMFRQFPIQFESKKDGYENCNDYQKQSKIVKIISESLIGIDHFLAKGTA